MHGLVRLVISLGILGLLLAFWSLVRVSVRRPYWPTLLAGLVLIVASAGTAVYVALSPPGLEDTVPEKHRDGPPEHVRNLVECLQARWGSESEAHWPVAGKLALCSQIAYEPPMNAKGSFEKLGFQSTDTIVKGSMLGYVVSVNDAVVVAFRGTDDELDWFTNLDSVMVSTPDGPIHRGFQNAYLSLKPQIVELLRRHEPKYLWITGHSLGGALAVACAFDLVEHEHHELTGVMTFGQPMVAGQQLANHLDDLLFDRFAHFVNEADVVPRVPPGLTHCGSLVWFVNGGIRRSKPKRATYGATPSRVPSAEQGEVLEPLSESEFEQRKAELRSTRAVKRLPDGRPLYGGSLPFIEDHSIDLYLGKVRKLVVGIPTAAPRRPINRDLE